MSNVGLKTSKAERAIFYKNIKNSPLAKVSFEFIASILLILVLFTFAIKPTIIAIQKVQNKIDELTNFDTGLKTKLDTLNKLIPIYQNNTSLISILNYSIPDQPDFTLFEKQLRYLLYKNNMKVMALTFSDFPIIKNTEKATDDPNSTPVNTDASMNLKDTNAIAYNLAVRGNYANAKSLLSQLQTLQRIVSVESVTISSESNQADDLIVGISGSIYYGKFK
jgi:hypothetical protein